jgi:hypothetical protein
MAISDILHVDEIEKLTNLMNLFVTGQVFLCRDLSSQLIVLTAPSPYVHRVTCTSCTFDDPRYSQSRVRSE